MPNDSILFVARMALACSNTVLAVASSGAEAAELQQDPSIQSRATQGGFKAVGQGSPGVLGFRADVIVMQESLYHLLSNEHSHNNSWFLNSLSCRLTPGGTFCLVP